LHLAPSRGNIKAGFQVSGIYPFNKDIYHYEEFMGAYSTDRSNLLWLQQLPTVTVNPQRRQLILQDHKHLLQKKKTHPSSPEDIRPLPKDGHRKNQNINKQKRTTVILTDYIVKYALKKKNYKAILGGN
jgi:hypothetical protein